MVGGGGVIGGGVGYIKVVGVKRLEVDWGWREGRVGGGGLEGGKVGVGGGGWE